MLTAPPIDYMTDHEITSVLVRQACFSASVPNYSTRQWNPAPPLTTIPYLYYVDAVERIDWFGKPQPPDFIVDVTPVYELKQNMLARHESQRNWLRKQEVDEYLEGVPGGPPPAAAKSASKTAKPSASNRPPVSPRRPPGRTRRRVQGQGSGIEKGKEDEGADWAHAVCRSLVIPDP